MERDYVVNLNTLLISMIKGLSYPYQHRRGVRKGVMRMIGLWYGSNDSFVLGFSAFKYRIHRRIQSVIWLGVAAFAMTREMCP